MFGVDRILKAADLIADIRKAFAKIENLEQGQRRLADTMALLEQRVREVEAGLREARAEIKLETVKETQGIVNAVQGQFYAELRNLAVSVDRLGRDSLALPALVRSEVGAGPDGEDISSTNQAATRHDG